MINILLSVLLASSSYGGYGTGYDNCYNFPNSDCYSTFYPNTSVPPGNNLTADDGSTVLTADDGSTALTAR